MKLELLMKEIDRTSFIKDPEEAKLKKLIDGVDETDDFKEVSYTYNPYTIDMRDVGTFGKDDEEHTKIVTPFALYFAKVDYTTFKAIYENWSGHQVRTLKDYRMLRTR